MIERRQRALLITPDILLEILKPGTTIIRPDGQQIDLATHPSLPDNVQVHHAYYDPQRGSFAIVIQDESFRVIPQGGCLEHIELEATLRLPNYMLPMGGT